MEELPIRKGPLMAAALFGLYGMSLPAARAEQGTAGNAPSRRNPWKSTIPTAEREKRRAKRKAAEASKKRNRKS